MAPSNAKSTPPVNAGSTPQVVEFNEMTEPGCYVTEQGELLRVPSEALSAGHSPRITIVSSDGTRVTKISHDPNLPIGKARQLAADADQFVRF